MRSLKLPVLLALILATSSSSILGQEFTECAVSLKFRLDGNAQDSGPFAQHGTVSGAKHTEGRFGKQNTAYEFDGVDDMISFPSDSMLNDTFSMATWVKVYSNPAVGESQAICSFGSNGADHSIMLSNNTGFQHVGFGFGSIGTLQSNIWTDSLPDTNVWYHIVVSRTASTLKIYVNGKLEDSLQTAVPIFGNSPSAAMGSRRGTNQYFHGAIDELSYYPCLLSQSAIEVLASDTLMASSIPEHNSTEYRVFPNPTRSIIYIDGPKADKLILYNIHGELIKLAAHQDKMHLKGLPTGIYFLKIESLEGVHTQEIVLH